MKKLGGFAAGAAIGMMVAGVASGIGSYVLVKMAEADARRGWLLVPVAVYTKDLPAGRAVEFDDLSLRSIPEQLVTASVVKPDSASYVIRQKLLVPVRAGDPALWAQYEVTPEEVGKMAGHVEAMGACRARVGAVDPGLTLEAIRAQQLARQGKKP